MKILIADAESGHASGLGAWLVENGWDAPALVATSDEAVEWINQNGRVDVLVTDVFLQPADGLTLRESLLLHLPKMKTIFLSAYDVSEHAVRMEGCPLLLKPASGEALDTAIRSLYEPKPAVVAATPVAATPKAVAVATARPAVAAPTVVAAAQPKPAVVPAAPVPVAQPTAQAVARPVAQPVAQAMAQPVVQPTAQAVARPVAQPTAPAVARPVAQPVGQAMAQPVAQPTAQAVVRPVAQPTAPAMARPVAQPVGQAMAQPVAQPTAQAVVRPVAQPTAQAVVRPVAQPVAPAMARPVAQPTAQAVAQPVAQAMAQPVAQPTAQAVAQPVAQAMAQPVAQPTAQAVAQPVAQAMAQPVAQPTAQAVARPVAQPTALGVARPVAQAVARPAVAQAVPVVAKASVVAGVAKTPPSSEIELPPDELVGTTINNYQIEAKIGVSSQGGIYRATQTNMARHVRFYTLDRARAADPAEIQKFIANASMKANVSHPYIFAVYEAGEGDGIYFYSCEYAPCRSLGQLREAGLPMDENSALQVMKVASVALGYFFKENITHNLISENSILLAHHNRPRIANIAAYQTTQEFDRAAEMSRLGSIISSVLPEASQASGVGLLARSLAAGEVTYPDWAAFTKAVEDLEPKIAPEDAYKLDAQERAAIRMVEEAKKRRKKNMIINTVVSLFLLATALGSVWWLLRNGGASVRAFDRMIEVPAGEFIYQDGQKVTLPAFYIDEFEVTIGQYAQFLEDINANPEKLKQLEHPDQPKGKSHIPEGWADMQELDPPMLGYYARARGWGRYKDTTLDVNCPVFGLDWFDAYAYAKWKGRRLPSEQEWEKAARGTEGFQYPWGNEDHPAWVNSGNDTNPDPKKGGEVDGGDRWSPVDVMKRDKSPFGVRDMAGNVSEWTASMEVDPKMSSAKVPVIRGGNWRTPKDYAVTRRVLKLTELQADEALGFRTVSDTPPPK